ncbi:MAG: histidine--tRNA ligase [Nanoarchaeota archaeon]|nr:histidine--tRNA ligase [Nanoarchaeota archaeon]
MKEEFELSLAKGVRDFPPEEKILRDQILQTIKEVFELYGYNPIELPILERYETLAAKYAAGEESDALKEIFVTRDNGNRELGLRFDLTVPFSRFIGMNPDLKMPFKKYVTGQVFRDGPLKKGRYREFTQFDPDIVGCTDVIADAEIMSITETVFTKLGFECEIEFNNRKLINGILDDLKIPEKDHFSVVVSIDKFKKVGKAGVEAELLEKNMDKKAIERLFKYLEVGKTNDETLNNLKGLVKSEIGKEGVKEVEALINYSKEYGLSHVKFIPSLARGLAYYTGPIYEAFLKDSTITSSAAGGGRYDELIGKFLGGKQQIPATGISFGIEVIVEAMKEKGLAEKKSVTRAYVIPIKTRTKCIKIVQELRKAGINTDMDLMERGISKNLDYANHYKIPFVVFAGEKELSEGKVKLRDMGSGTEEMVTVAEAVKRLKA